MQTRPATLTLQSAEALLETPEQAKQRVSEHLQTRFESNAFGGQFYTQAEALEFSQSHGALPVFGYDKDAPPEGPLLDKHGRPVNPKTYVCTSYRRMLNLCRKTEPDKRRYYELVSPDEWCHLYIDLDLDLTANPDRTPALCAKLHDDFKLHLRTFLRDSFPSLLTSDDCVRFSELSSSSQTKFSVHFIVHLQDACFSNYRHVGAFVRRFSRYLIEKEGSPEISRYYAWGGEKVPAPADRPVGLELRQLLEGGDNAMRSHYKSIMDLKIYTLHRLFRFYGQHKGGSSAQKRTMWLHSEVAQRCVTDIYSDEGARLDDAPFFESMIQHFAEPPTHALVVSEFDGSEASGTSSLWDHIFPMVIGGGLMRRQSSLPGVSNSLKRKLNEDSSEKSFVDALHEFLHKEFSADFTARPYDSAYDSITFASHTREHCRLHGRRHSGNNIYVIVYLRSATYSQKCHHGGPNERTPPAPLGPVLAQKCAKFLRLERERDQHDLSALFAFLRK